MERYIDIIRSRRSVRTFEDRPISNIDIDYINKYIEDNDNLNGIFNNNIDIKYINVEKNETDEKIKLGTYGFIKNPQGYILGKSINNSKSLIDYGYVFEKMVLYLTSISVGTCWLGGTFKRSSFTKTLDIDNGEIIPAITPVGYGSEQRLKEKIIRKVAGSNNRKEWEEIFFDKSFDNPLSKSSNTKFNTPLEMVNIGPSASNRQPWRLLVDDKMVHFYIDLDLSYSGNKIGYEMQWLDLGIAMCHFELSCKELDIKGKYIEKDPMIKSPYEYVVSWYNE